MATVTPIEEIPAVETPIPTKKRGFKKQPAKNTTPEAPAAETPTLKPFWDRVTDLTNEDWQRSELFLYLLEPVADLIKLTGKKYYKKYTAADAAPRSDLDIVKEFGSGKYRVMLNRRKPGADKSDMVDMHEFTEFNMNFPPKLARRLWLKDPRNERGESMLPEEPSAAAVNGNQPSSMLDTIKVLNEIRRDAREEAMDMQPIPPEPPDPMAQLKGAVDIVKTLSPQDKKEDGSALMLKMMEIQQKSTEATMAAMRVEMAEARKREHELQMKLIEIRTAPAQQDEITKKIVDKALDKVLNPENAEAIPLKSKGPWWGDMVHDLVVALPNSPVMANLSQAALLWTQASAMSKTGAKSGAVTPAPMPNAPPPRPVQTIDAGPGVPPAPEPHPNAAQQPEAPPVGPITPGMKLAPEQLAPFVGIIAEPLMNLLNSPDCDGARLADWCIVQKGQMQYDFVANQGPEILLQAIRLSPFWGGFQLQSYPAHPGFAHFEPQLKTLLADFCDPSDDEDDEEDQDNNDGKPEDILG